MRYKPIRWALSPNLLSRFPKGQCLSLGKSIGQKHVVMTSHGIQRFSKREKITWYETCSLMDKLTKRILTVRARFTPVYRAGRLSNLCPNKCDVFAITFHRQLLQVCRESAEVLLIRQKRDCLHSEEIYIPNCQKAHQDRNIPLEGSGEEVHIHVMKAI